MMVEEAKDGLMMGSRDNMKIGLSFFNVRKERLSSIAMRPVMGDRKLLLKNMASVRDDSDDEFGDSVSGLKWIFLEGMAMSAGDYYTVMKTINNMRVGDQTATLAALNTLLELDWSDGYNLLGLRDANAFELLPNILETRHEGCRFATLQLVLMLVEEYNPRQIFAYNGTVGALIHLLGSNIYEESILAADALAKLGRVRKVRDDMRMFNGLDRLLDMMDIPNQIVKTSTPDAASAILLKRAITACWAVRVAVQDKENADVMVAMGLPNVLPRLVVSPFMDLVIPVMGIISEVGSEPPYFIALETGNVVRTIVKYMLTEEVELKRNCVTAISFCAYSAQSRELVRKHKGLTPLIDIIKDDRSDAPMQTACAASIAQLSETPQNAVVFNNAGAVNALVNLITGSVKEDEVEAMVARALAKLMEQIPELRQTVLALGVVSKFVDMVRGGAPTLQCHGAGALRELAKDPECCLEIDKHDGIELTWSLLKNEDMSVRTAAAFALVPMLENIPDAGEVVRSIVGAMELTVHVLKVSTHEITLKASTSSRRGILPPSIMEKTRRHLTKVTTPDQQQEVERCQEQAALCWLFEVLTRDPENATILRDMGVCDSLVILFDKEDTELLTALGEAVAGVCMAPGNAHFFGEKLAIKYFVRFLREGMLTGDSKFLRGTTRALAALSQDHNNCQLIHTESAIPLLVEVAADHPAARESALQCVANIRKLAAECDRFESFQGPPSALPQNPFAADMLIGRKPTTI